LLLTYSYICSNIVDQNLNLKENIDVRKLTQMILLPKENIRPSQGSDCTEKIKIKPSQGSDCTEKINSPFRACCPCMAAQKFSFDIIHQCLDGCQYLIVPFTKKNCR
jgi:hypothetical protein